MQNLAKLIVVILIGLVIFSILMLIVAGLGAAPFLGCYMRYSDASQPRSATVTTQLNANGRYDGLTCNPGEPSCPTSGYGQWQRVAMNLQQGAKVLIDISGQVSLCQAYTTDASRTTIPRVSSEGSASDANLGVPIILPAGASPITVANLYVNDLVQIRVANNLHVSNPSPVLDITQNNAPVNANCSDGQTRYSPICGKYSFYVNYPYYASSSDCLKMEPSHCYDSIVGFLGLDDLKEIDGACTSKGYTIVQKHVSLGDCDCWGDLCVGTKYKNVCFKYNYSGTLPQPYSDSYLFAQGANIDQRNYYQPPAPSASNPVCPAMPWPIKSWFAFDQGVASGMTYAIGGGQYSAANLLQDCSDQSNPNCQGYSKRYIINQKTNVSGALKYQFYNTNLSASSYTGGYVFYLKQTKCYRQNGEYFPADSSGDTVDARGQLQYVILTSNANPNTNQSLVSNPVGIKFQNGQSSINSAPTDGYLWFRIYNNASDYQYSTGSYNLSITQNLGSSQNSQPDVWNGITNLFINKWQDVSKKMFQGMTCYGASDKSDCTNLFKLIQAFLIAYLMLLGMNFAIGAVRMNQMELLLQVGKVIVVAGLLNDNTFNFFNLYLFDLIFKAT